MYAKLHKAIGVCLFTYFLVMIFTIVVGSLVDDGVILQIWLSMVSEIPFGKFFSELAVNIFTEGFGMGLDVNTYLINANKLTFVKVLEDTCCLMLTALVYQAVDYACQALLGVAGKQSGLHNILMQACSKIIAIMISTFIATILVGFLYGQLSKLSQVWQGGISGIVSLITVIGAFGVAQTVLVAGFWGIIAFVCIKVILVNLLKVSASYIALLLLIIFVNEGAIGYAVGVFGGWAAIIIMLTAIELMMDGLFSYR